MSISKYKLSRNPWQVNGSYQVTDEHDIQVCEAKKSVFSLKSKAIVYDSMGEVAFYIKKDIFAFFKTVFYIHSDNAPIYKFSKASFSLRTSVIVEALHNRDAFLISGDIWGMEYTFYRNNRAFAKVSKKMWAFSNDYGLAVEDKEDELLIISAVITLDLIKRAKRS